MDDLDDRAWMSEHGRGGKQGWGGWTGGEEKMEQKWEVWTGECGWRGVEREIGSMGGDRVSGDGEARVG